jgi:hypothetical protein
MSPGLLLELHQQSRTILIVVTHSIETGGEVSDLVTECRTAHFEQLGMNTSKSGQGAI